MPKPMSPYSALRPYRKAAGLSCALAALSLTFGCTSGIPERPVAEGGQTPTQVVASRWPEAPPAESSHVRAVRTVAVEPPEQRPAPAVASAPVITMSANTANALVPAEAETPAAVVPTGKTQLAHFASAPFPYAGEAARLPSGRVLRTGRSYSDDRVLLHIPEGFDPNKPAVMVVFFHGHGAELARDVLERQQVPAQISMADTNAVLVAPQFAVNAADSNPGRLGQPGGFARFVTEAGRKLAQLSGNANRPRMFDKTPVVIVAYSGAYVPAATSLTSGGLGKRVRGVVLLDALYGELGTFAGWIKANPKGFFLSAYTSSTRRNHEEFARLLEAQGTRFGTEMPDRLWRGRVALIATDGEVVNHRDFVTRAWAEYPIKDLLTKLN